MSFTEQGADYVSTMHRENLHSRHATRPSGSVSTLLRHYK